MCSYCVNGKSELRLNVSRRSFLRYAGMCFAGLGLSGWTRASERDAGHSRRPNIVYIMADDLGIGDVKCYGRERCKIDTPNIDRLAAEGMMFTDAHAPASVCVPVRVGIMTGRYAWRFARTRPDGPWGFLNPRLPAGQFTLGSMMKGAGFSTHYVGKWHLGTLMQTVDGKNQGPGNVDYTKPLKVGPGDYGFDYSFILPGSLDMYPYVFVRNGEFAGRVTAQKGWSAFNRVGPAAEDFEDVKVLDTFSREAEDVIGRCGKAARGGKPFFLYLALTSPHTPTSPRAAFQGKSKLGLYGDFVMETDDCVGRVANALKRHGLERDTLVIVTSDHGAAPYAGNIAKATAGQLKNLEELGHYSSGIYRGYKFSAYEGGFRVPYVVRWPGVVEAGSRCDGLIALNDLMATLADVCGLELPEEAGADSISFLRVLKDAGAEAARESMIMKSTRSFVVREGAWKLLLCPHSGCDGRFGNKPTEQEGWKKALAAFGRLPNADDLKRAPFVQLFDLENDPTESVNLASKHPGKVRELIALLERQIAAGRSTPGPRLKNDVERVNYLGGVPQSARNILKAGK